MRILVIGTGGVGSAFAAIAQRRSFFDRITLADIDPSRPQAVVDRLGDHDRFNAARIDASSEDSILDACLQARVTYLDMAATLSQPHPEHPYSETHVKLADYQFAQYENWRQADQLALIGIGIEPGAADVFARHAADKLFSEIDEIGIRDGANLVVEGYEFAPTFSIWTTIEECLNPPVIWEKGRGWFTTEPFSEPETFDFPDHVVDNEWSMREYGSQAVVWQTALNPVVALELLAEGAWGDVGVLGPEAFPAQPYLDKLAAFGSPHGVLELDP